MNAVVLAGGFGSRLKPLTEKIPKPMLSIANTPMLDYTASHLLAYGIRDIVFTLGYYPEQIISWCKGYRDIQCHFSIETRPLGTAGGVRDTLDLLDDVFLVVSGDALENIDFSQLVYKHLSSGVDVTMAVTRVDNPSLYGVVELDKEGVVTGFCEKPATGTEKSNLVNCGVYVVNRSAMEQIPKGMTFDFSRDFFPMLLAKKRIAAYVHDGYWCDIGDMKSYFESNFALLGGGFFTPAYNNNRPFYQSRIVGSQYPSCVGLSTHLVGECRQSVVGHGAAIASGASVDNCIVLDGTVVKGRYINSIISENFTITVPSGAVSSIRPVLFGNFRNFY